MKIVVFLDVQSEKLRSTIASEAAVGDSAEIVQCQGSLAHTIRHRGVKQSDKADTFTCFITEKQSLHNADVVYALFCKRLPVLSLIESKSISVSLLETLSTLGVDNLGNLLDAQIAAIKAFFSFQPKKGQVFVFEGGDGVGKATQTKLLFTHLEHLGYSVATLDFPSERNRYGGLLREVLSGKKGGIHELDPKLFSLLFSLNRFACMPELQYWMCRGRKIILDRYYTANCGHQASKLPEEERKKFIHYLQTMEVSWFGLPPADIVLYLDLPPQAAMNAMKKDQDRGPLDIHETAQSNYKETVRQTYLWCCHELPNWFHIECCDIKGSRLGREETHNLVYNVIKGNLI
ncbi:thymidylate kinase [Trypanosoma theileri]|uniref:dTMP kinase n=1 Tax=Trypanosoma theileri TaxID=67003 RepID=A0A1X0NRS1_9TRYP|nr:thymidylate kinase [Trypanosoma theileri]ORC86810.1 thymidylate kinase [Trypanosoma theileri]